MNAAATALPLSALPTKFHAPARAQMRRWAPLHGVRFTRALHIRCSYYMGTPRLLVSAQVAGDADATDFMLFEIYIGESDSLGRLALAQFHALWEASNPPMHLF